MAGHSKWAQIKRQKGANDHKRGQMFTKVAREITVAARAGGPNPDANVRLRLAVQKARSINMPNDNIERAISRATSAEAQSSNFEEIYYEAYGPQGSALMVQALTDNRNRTVSEVRAALTRGGGRMADVGSVAYLFDQLGVIRVKLDGQDTDEMTLLAIDAGATDMRTDDEAKDELEFTTEVGSLRAVQEALEDQGVEVLMAEVNMVPKSRVEIDEQHAAQVLRLIERLEDLDDVQSVYTNVELSEDVMEHVAASA